MTSMFLNMWNKHGHVCENYSPFEDAEDCTGDKFYHWGALAGMISLVEEAENIALEMLPFLAVEATVILLITYFPALTMTLPTYFGFA